MRRRWARDVDAELAGLTEAEALRHCRTMLRAILGDGRTVGQLCLRFGLTKAEAVLLHRLAMTPGECVPLDALHALISENTESFEQATRVRVCKLRQKTGLPIRAIRGLGYVLEADIAEIDLTLAPVPRWRRQGWPWSEDDDGVLREMVANGSQLWAIAEELERSEHAVRDRIRALRLRPPGVGSAAVVGYKRA